ncbi:MAG: MotA/TolQ/ExbB proton channel family protein [Flavobacteriales bacterium]|nr:MotA/TolQ/ExbB proton channel family protein [Flavobacteriales bacterium]NNK81482.1 MotA/TolQ/ExbB proton channel family protein [Flavobacteriales bacterium]
MELLFLLQMNVASDTLSTATEAMNEMANEETISVWQMIKDGGWYIMGPLALLSIIAIYIFVERMLAIGRAGRVEKDFMNRIKDYIHDGKIDSAVDLCRQADTPVSRMINKGISKIGRPIKEISDSIENVGKLEIGKMEKGLSTLATVAGAAPMIGFLGTVIGMIQTFHQMKISASGVEISALSGGIMQAMVTTVGGLIIGIIAYIAYNILVTRMNKVIHGLEASSIDFLDVLDAPAK